jgi:hypothetical protein
MLEYTAQAFNILCERDTDNDLTRENAFEEENYQLHVQLSPEPQHERVEHRGGRSVESLTAEAFGS